MQVRLMRLRVSHYPSRALQNQAVSVDTRNMVPRLRVHALVCLTVATTGIGAAVTPIKHIVDSPLIAVTTTLPGVITRTSRPDPSRFDVPRRADAPTRVDFSAVGAADHRAGLTRIESLGVGVAAALTIIVSYLGVRTLRRLARRMFRRRRPIGA